MIAYLENTNISNKVKSYRMLSVLTKCHVYVDCVFPEIKSLEIHINMNPCYILEYL